ncbi:VOC family protein [Dyella sp. A6]|uniref:VOC family protein n=1 Tax=Dyella aluminiiresistens TaxID=3069105 RepID=UPI002E784420|nr:VOC family protein [Dyella sp. A6]
MQIHPYLFFDGRCEEAIAFYRQALDAEVLMLMHYADGPQGSGCPEGAMPPGDKVMHASLRIGDAQLMVSDGFSRGQPQFAGTALSLTLADDAEAARRFAALADGGQVKQPLAPTFFASSFGMLEDRFGVPWMLVVPVPPPG